MTQVRLLQALLLISTTALLIPLIPLAEAASPTLKVTSSRIVANGSTVIINVEISHFAPRCCIFDTFDIFVHTNAAVLNPVSITIGPKVATWLQFSNCVNGGSVGGALGCTINDGGGIAHLGASSSSGVPIFSHGPSVLFSITYTAVNGAPFTTTITATGTATGTIFHAGVAIAFITVNGSYS